jgi:hypothetical protein
MNARDLSTCDVPETDHYSLSLLGNLVRARLGRRVRDFRVVLRRGGLVLQGIAGSYHAKQLAQHLAMAVTELPLTANEIEVVYPDRLASGPDGVNEAVVNDPQT